jgi:hypothetical protein
MARNGDYFAAAAAAIGVGDDVFAENFTLEHVEETVGRIPRAIDAARPRT